jgi:hypothetical protein
MRNLRIEKTEQQLKKNPFLFCYTGKDKKNKREKGKN